MAGISVPVTRSLPQRQRYMTTAWDTDTANISGNTTTTYTSAAAALAGAR